jgi:Protein of unknown function (DUF3105)
MANRKKKRQRRPSGPATTAPKASVEDPSEAAQAPSRGGANMARRERKEQARAAREAERKRAARHAAFRRAAVFSVIGLAAVGVLFWLQRAASPSDLSAEAKTAASSANCSEVITPLGNAPAGEHVPQGTPITYDQRPPTSGQHYQEVVAAQDPAILTEPLDEPASVHFLEHAGIIAYYRDSGDAALPDDVVSAVGEIATAQPNMLMAPFPDLPDGTSLALTAWNKELTCPGSVTAAQARTIANGFADAFVCTSNAPEPNASGAC